jgi:hypothetical protein
MAISAQRSVNILEDKNKTLFTLFEKDYIVLKGEGRGFRLKRVVGAFAKESPVYFYTYRQFDSAHTSSRRIFNYTQTEVELFA